MPYVVSYDLNTQHEAFFDSQNQWACSMCSRPEAAQVSGSIVLQMYPPLALLGILFAS